MRTEIKAATGLDAAGPVAKIRNHQQAYTRSLPKSNAILKERVGLLLWRLQVPLNQQHRKIGWSLFSVLLGQYLVGRYERRRCAGQANSERAD